MAETVTAVCYTLLCALVVTVLLKLRASSGRHAAGLNLPPRPWPLPVIGNMHCLLGALPHHAMRRLAQRYGPVMLLRLGHVRAVVVSSPEAAREVMKTHDAVLANRPLYVTMDIFTYGGRGISFAPYGSRHWKELRRLCATELLSARRILSFRPIREEETASLVRSVAASPVVNVSDRVKLLLNDIIVRAIVGSRCPQREAYLQEMEKALNLLAGFNLIDLFPTSRLARVLGGRSLRAARQVHARIDSIVGDMIWDHATAMESKVAVAAGDGAADSSEDLLDTLLRLQKDGELENTLSTEAISATLFELFSAGSETTATTITWAMSQLMRNPQAMERAQSEIRELLRGKAKVREEDVEGRLRYLQMVIKETLRLHPPVPLILPRFCAEPCKIMGYDIPAQTTMFVNVWAIGRDDKNWTDAKEFRPERFEDGTVDFNGADFRFLPGGAGRRMCPGLMFGVASIEFTLASLLYHFDWKLPNGVGSSELDMTESYGITAHRRTDLWLEATPFVPLD